MNNKIFKISIYIILSLFLIFIWFFCYINKEPVISHSKLSENIENETEYYNFDWIIVLDLFSENNYTNWYFHWKKLKNEINTLLTFFKTKIVKNDILSIKKSIFKYRVKKYIPFIKDEYLEEMKGIADWANVAFTDILLINIYDELMNESWCSSLVIPKSEIAENFYHARNLDYNLPILAKYKVLLKYKDYISVWFPWYIWWITWANYEWISLSSHTAYSKEDNKIATPSWFIYKEILSKAKSIKDVEDILKNSNISIANNLAIWSKNENKAVVFEFDSKNIVKRSINNNTDNNYIISTNNYLTPKMKEFSKYDNQTNSKERYNQYIEQIKKEWYLWLHNIMNIMWYYDESKKWWSTIANKWTVQSVIMNTSDNVIYIAKWVNTPVTKDWYEAILY